MSDKQRYDELATVMLGLLESGREDDPGLEAAWREIEQIKARHGGMPPREQYPDAQTKPAVLASPEDMQAVGRGDRAATTSCGNAHNCGVSTCGSAGSL